MRKSLEAGAQPAFPPSVVVDVKRLACELPSHSDVPLARFTIPELHREVLARGIFRTGALTYLAAWDVHHAKLFGRCEPKTTIGAVDRLVEQVMTTEPYRSARRVFWIADNCSSHRGDKGAASAAAVPSLRCLA